LAQTYGVVKPEADENWSKLSRYNLTDIIGSEKMGGVGSSPIRGEMGGLKKAAPSPRHGKRELLGRVAERVNVF
jgi:hypothetical protein